MSTPMENLLEKRSQAMKNIESKGFYGTKRVYVGMATCEIAAGSKEVMDVFENAKKNGVAFYLSQKGCAGRCSVEPTVEVVEEGKDPVLYCKVTVDAAKQIVEDHILNNKPVNEFIGE